MLLSAGGWPAVRATNWVKVDRLRNDVDRSRERYFICLKISDDRYHETVHG
jgi:hypothetical protein